MRQCRSARIRFARDRNLIRRILPAAAIAAVLAGPAAAADDEAGLYTSKVIVTGQGEENRLLGFRQCVPQMLVRVSGDQRLVDHAGMDAIVENAAAHVAAFTYRDRLAGKPIHDEQGTYDRPHDLTCIFDPAHADDLLAELGSKPWPLPRRGVVVFLHGQRDPGGFALAADGDQSPYMRESLALAAEPLALDVTLPPSGILPALGNALPDVDRLATLARGLGDAAPLAITLEWSDADLGWVANFRMVDEKGLHDWSASGVSFDEAFRIGLRGAAQILSGNGAP
jgi:hypothetical protein